VHPDATHSRRSAHAWFSAIRPPVWLLPVAVMAVLCIPVLRLGYFWDDFVFLTERHTGGLFGFALPTGEGVLYRPVSQYLYFQILRLIDDPSGLTGHLLNLGVLLLSVALLVVLMTKLRGRVAGVTTGLVFATLAPIPCLVAWVSCDQDLLAIAFLLGALLLRHERKDWAAVACAAAALLSKEPALCFFPVLIFWDQLVGRDAARTWTHAARYVAVAGVWLLIHPSLRRLLLRGFESGTTGYVGLTGGGSGFDHLGRYLLTLVNLPATGLSTPWPSGLLWTGVVSVALILGWTWIRGSEGESRSEVPVSMARITAIGFLLLVPPLIVPAFLVRHWATYYVSIPAVGVAIVAGAWLARVRPTVRMAFFLLFVPLGIWSRGTYYGQLSHEVGKGEQVAWSEQSFVVTSRAVREVRRNFKQLYPTFPKGAQVLVSTTAIGIRGIGSMLLEYNALQVWYRDPTLITRRAERYDPRGTADFLVRVTSNLSVVAIDPDHMRVEWAGGAAPDPWEVNRPIRNYARGLAAAGEWDRAVANLQALANAEQGMERAYDWRLIAMLRLAQGKKSEAAAIMDTTYAFPWDVSVEIVKKLFTESSSSSAIDSCAYQAFGLSETDPNVLRYLMRKFWTEKWVPEAVHFARRLEALGQGDAETKDLLEKSKGLPDRPR